MDYGHIFGGILLQLPMEFRGVFKDDTVVEILPCLVVATQSVYEDNTCTWHRLIRLFGVFFHH